MPAYKDKKTNKWYAKFNYKNWKGETKFTTKRGFSTKREAVEYESEFKLHIAGDLDMNFEEFVKVYREEHYYNISPISGIFKSFHDAPNGGKEELQEIQWSVGMEYAYNNQFFLRAGYHYEHPNKGNRKYYTLGAGFKMSVFSIDAGYVISAAQSNPLDQTLRFSIAFDMDGIQDILGKRRR